MGGAGYGFCIMSFLVLFVVCVWVFVTQAIALGSRVGDRVKPLTLLLVRFLGDDIGREGQQFSTQTHV